MQIQFLKKLKVKIVVDNPDFMPKDCNSKEYYDVVGVESYNKKTIKDNVEKWHKVLNFFIINDILKLVTVASFNCQVLIDEKIQAVTKE